MAHAQELATPDKIDDLDSKFQRLVARWRADTRFVSSVTKMAMNPAYQQIIGMGVPAIAMLLRELARQPDHWFWALQSITGVDPTAREDQGDLARMTGAWLEWGRRNGYLA